jgi:hypothetical protein
MRRVLIVGALTAFAAAAVALAGQGASASFGGSSGCVTLPATAKLRSTLLRVHRATLDAAEIKTTGPFGRVYYGRCPRAFYALATFRHKTAKVDFGGQDQPERFQRRVGGAWRDRGDTGGFVCEAAPKALLELWSLHESCG